MKSFSGIRNALTLEFAAGQHIAVVVDEDGLIYYANEYDWRERGRYKIDYWQADAE
jgi:hypothetical protein